jgi:hypothetical protein
VSLVVDTGILVSGVDTSEARHRESAQLLRDHAGALVVPAPVIPETAWFIESRLGPAAESKFLRLVTDGELSVIDLTLADYQRCISLIDTYADLGLGLVDASIVTVAENLGITTVATYNHRDFLVVRPRHAEALTLLP